jgi:hypothetical protein
VSGQCDRPEVGGHYRVSGRYFVRIVGRTDARFDALLETGAVVSLPDGTPAVACEPGAFRMPSPTVREHRANLGKVKTDRDLYVYARAYLPADVVEKMEDYHAAEQHSFASRQVSVVSAILRKNPV